MQSIHDTFMTYRISAVLFASMLFLLLSCSNVSTRSADEIHGLLYGPDKRKSIVLVDIRNAAKYADGHIPGAIHISVRSKKFKEQLSSHDDKPILILYCGQGLKTGKAAEIAEKTGFKKIYILDGGLSSWKDRGYPVESN